MKKSMDHNRSGSIDRCGRISEFYRGGDQQKRTEKCDVPERETDGGTGGAGTGRK